MVALMTEEVSPEVEERVNEVIGCADAILEEYG